MATDYISSLIAGFKKKEAAALKSNLEREQEIRSIFDTQLEAYAQGGAFEKASLALLGKEKVRDVGATAQRDISRGMYGIRPYEQEWESNVGAQARLNLEDIMQQRRASVLSAKASFLEGIQDPYPDYGALMNAVSSGASVGGRTYGGTYGNQPSQLSGLSGERLESPPPDMSAAYAARNKASQALIGSANANIRGGGGQLGTASAEEVAMATDPSQWTDEAIAEREDAGWEKNVATNASLLSQYNRYKKGLQAQGIGEDSIAEYKYWYKANYLDKAAGSAGQYLAQHPDEKKKKKVAFKDSVFSQKPISVGGMYGI